MVLLEGTLKTYDWGSKSAIAELRGVTPSGRPEAELWFQAEEKLPWLVKILAIQKPLSVQLHPNAEQAVRGFEAEESKGIRLDDPKRSYRDKKAKSELVCAVTPFKAFCGLREINEAIEAASQFNLPEEIYAPLLSNRSESWKEVIERILSGNWNQCILDLEKRCSEKIGNSWDTTAEEILKICEFHRDDESILLLPFMNYYELNAGDALHVKPGMVHVYLEGMAVEVMEYGDNVIRAGLTKKHVDKSEFLSLLDTKAKLPPVQTPSEKDYLYSGPTEKLTVRRIENATVEIRDSTGTDLILSTDGLTTVKFDEEVNLRQGEALLIDEENESYTVNTSGVLFLVREEA